MARLKPDQALGASAHHVACVAPSDSRRYKLACHPTALRSPVSQGSTMDHDQRFKTLIQVFFAEFLALFFASWARRFHSASVEWLDKEVFPDPPEGPRRILDLVAKVATREEVSAREGEPGSFLALVHIEIESPDKAAPLRPRRFRSYTQL